MLLDRCPVCLSVLSVTLLHCGQTFGRIKMKLGMQMMQVGRPRPWPHCVTRGHSSSSPKRHTPIFGPYLLRPNGWMNQDATWDWYGGIGLSPGEFVLDVDPASPPQKGAEIPSQFSAHFYFGKRWIHPDATWYGGMPQPRGRCVRWRLSPLLKKGAELPNFRPMFFCGQTAGWVKMSLGMEADLSPGDFVLDGDPVHPPQKVAVPLPNLRPISIVANGWMYQHTTWYGGRPQPRELCVRWGPRPSPKGDGAPIFGPCLLRPNGSMDQDATHCA